MVLMKAISSVFPEDEIIAEEENKSLQDESIRSEIKAVLAEFGLPVDLHSFFASTNICSSWSIRSLRKAVIAFGQSILLMEPKVSSETNNMPSVSP